MYTDGVRGQAVASVSPAGGGPTARWRAKTRLTPQIAVKGVAVLTGESVTPWGQGVPARRGSRGHGARTTARTGGSAAGVCSGAPAGRGRPVTPAAGSADVSRGRPELCVSVSVSRGRATRATVTTGGSVPPGEGAASAPPAGRALCAGNRALRERSGVTAAGSAAAKTGVTVTPSTGTASVWTGTSGSGVSRSAGGACSGRPVPGPATA